LSHTVLEELVTVIMNIAFMSICWRCGVEADIKVQSALITISLVAFLKYEKVGYLGHNTLLPPVLSF